MKMYEKSETKRAEQRILQDLMVFIKALEEYNIKYIKLQKDIEDKKFEDYYYFESINVIGEFRSSKKPMYILVEEI